MSFYTSLLRPFFFQFDPESVHHFSMAMMGHTPLAKILTLGRPAPVRPVEVFGLKFRNPLGLAAGFDKNAQAMGAFHDLGFGFMEVGTITRHAQPGNPRPRIFRCPREQGLVNRMGFPNSGADALALRLSGWKPRPGFPIGINIGKSKVTELEDAHADYRYSLEKLYPHGDFFVVNVSSPNTPGLRNLQSPDQLRPILRSLQDFNLRAQSKPLLIKIAPDLAFEDIASILNLAMEEKLAGIVATNTTLDHSAITVRETGGLSGRPLAKRSTEIIRFIQRETSGKLPIIGAGGIFTHDDAEEKFDAGAVLIQTYSGFIYQGPHFAWQVLSRG